MCLKKPKILYIAQYMTEKCLQERNNHKCFSAAGFNKSKGIISMIENEGNEVIVLSPSFVNNKTGKVYKSVHENCNGQDLYHSIIWDIPYINMLTCILWISYTLFKKRIFYDKILFYNYTPETAIPAFFAKIFLQKKIYLEYEDGYFALDIFKPLKWLIAINEKIGNELISGAILVTENLKPRVKTNNIQVIPGIIDQDLYSYFSKLHMVKEMKVIMYSGSLDLIRGIDIYLEIAEEIINNIEGNYEFWVTGKGPQEQMVRDYIKKYSSKIRYYGFVSRDELLILYESVDVFVSLQKPEHEFSVYSSPSKIYEFISTGKFCVGLMDLKIDSNNYIYAQNLKSLKSILVNIVNGSYNQPSPVTLQNTKIHLF